MSVKSPLTSLSCLYLTRSSISFPSNSDMHPALFYLLEWHYQHLVLDENGPFIIRQHCASLLALIGYDRVQHVATGFTSQNWDRLFACFSKWFNTAAKYGVNEVITFHLRGHSRGGMLDSQPPTFELIARRKFSFFSFPRSCCWGPVWMWRPRCEPSPAVSIGAFSTVTLAPF